MIIARRIAPVLATVVLAASGARAQTPAQLTALKGLAPVSALTTTAAGRAALSANITVTGKVQEGMAGQPVLLPFGAQQQQAVRDAFSTVANASDLADGLGSALAGAYQAVARYTSTDGGRTFTFTSVSPSVERVLTYAHGTTHADSGMA
jgi:hypothetical protein